MKHTYLAFHKMGDAKTLIALASKKLHGVQKIYSNTNQHQSACEKKGLDLKVYVPLTEKAQHYNQD